ncbi:hypothetical protein ES704_03034 [subsurface metagenome]
MIKDERIKKLIEIVNKYRISPEIVAHIIGVSLTTYYRYKNGETIPQSQNTRNVIDSVIEGYTQKNK